MPLSTPLAFGGSVVSTATIDPDCGISVQSSSLALGGISDGDATVSGSFDVNNGGTTLATGEANAGVYNPPTTRTGGFTGDIDTITHIAPDETSLDADDGGTGNIGAVGLLNTGVDVTFIALDPLSIELVDRTVAFDVGNAISSPAGIQLVELPFDGAVTETVNITVTCGIP